MEQSQGWAAGFLTIQAATWNRYSLECRCSPLNESQRCCWLEGDLAKQSLVSCKSVLKSSLQRAPAALTRAWQACVHQSSTSSLEWIASKYHSRASLTKWLSFPMNECFHVLRFLHDVTPLFTCIVSNIIRSRVILRQSIVCHWSRKLRQYTDDGYSARI